MDKQHQADRWHKVSENSRKPLNGLLVQIVVSTPEMVNGSYHQVVPGFYNEYRKLWFTGERPVYPTHWRPLARLPRGLRK